MPINHELKHLYPKNWKEISEKIRFERANNECAFCGAENYKAHPLTGSKVILTVAHLDHNPANNDEANLKALCQKCHLAYDAKHHKENAKKTRIKKFYQGTSLLPFQNNPDQRRFVNPTFQTVPMEKLGNAVMDLIKNDLKNLGIIP